MLGSESQTVVVEPGTLKRQLQLNVTRTEGTEGQVRITFTMTYNEVC